MGLVSVVCEECEIPLKRYANKILAHVYCSQECRSLASYKKCLKCKKYFKRNNMDKVKYCSEPCYRSTIRPKVKVVCVECDKIFSKYACEVDKTLDRKSQHLCSRSCRNSYTSRILGGDGTWKPGGKWKKQSKYGKDWPKFKETALKRDGYECQSCGDTERLEVHHWEPYQLSLNNDLDNLVTFCYTCHHAVHKWYRAEGFYKPWKE